MRNTVWCQVRTNPRWREVRHRPRLLAGTVVLSLALVAVVVGAVTAVTVESWQAQADGVCRDYGYRYHAPMIRAKFLP
jgi:hypothetical protein